MTVADQLKTDLTAAMKAGEKDRVGALRMILSELQKDAKEGAGDEVAVLRRERKRRLDAAAQFRDGGRGELAAQEEGEAELIAAYLPAASCPTTRSTRSSRRRSPRRAPARRRTWAR